MLPISASLLHNVRCKQKASFSEAFWFMFEKLFWHRPAHRSGGTHRTAQLAVGLVGSDFVNRREANQDVDNPRHDGMRTTEKISNLPIEESDQQPIQPPNNEENPRYHVHDFHTISPPDERG